MAGRHRGRRNSLITFRPASGRGTGRAARGVPNAHKNASHGRPPKAAARCEEALYKFGKARSIPASEGERRDSAGPGLAVRALTFCLACHKEPQEAAVARHAELLVDALDVVGDRER